MRSYFIIGLLIFSIVLFIWIYYKNHDALKINEKITYFLAIALFIVPFIINNFLPEKNIDDFYTINKPYIEPTLIVEKDNNDELLFNFEIVNNGNFPANEIEFVYITPFFKGADLPFVKENQLGPQSKMILPFVLNKFDLSKGDIFKFKLIVLYHSKIRNKTKYFQSTFNFLISENNLKAGSYNYVSSIREENKMSTTEQLEYLDLRKALTKKEGTFTFLVKPGNFDKSSPTIFSRSLNKIFFWEPNSQSFIFQYLNDEKRYISYQRKIEGVLAEQYFVALTWSESQVNLFVKE